MSDNAYTSSRPVSVILGTLFHSKCKNSSHQHEKAEKAAQHARKGALHLGNEGDIENAEESFEPLVQFDEERDKAAPPSEDELARRKAATDNNLNAWETQAGEYPQTAKADLLTRDFLTGQRKPRR